MLRIAADNKMWTTCQHCFRRKHGCDCNIEDNDFKEDTSDDDEDAIQTLLKFGESSSGK